MRYLSISRLLCSVPVRHAGERFVQGGRGNCGVKFPWKASRSWAQLSQTSPGKAVLVHSLWFLFLGNPLQQSPWKRRGLRGRAPGQHRGVALEVPAGIGDCDPPGA